MPCLIAFDIRLVEREGAANTEKSEEEDTDDAETGTIIESIAEEEVEIVTASLEEITKVYVNAEHLIVSTCLLASSGWKLSQGHSSVLSCFW